MTESRRIELTVHEPGTRGTSRNAIRLPEFARRSLGVLSGDTVVVETEPALVATVWPARGGLPDTGVVLDESLRGRAGLAIGDTVSIRADHVPDATAISILLPNDAPDIQKETIRSVLEDRLIDVGDVFSVNDHSLRVVETQPTGTVKLTSTTTINLHARATEHHTPAASPPAISYADVGGLSDELTTVRETIELPVAEPEIFDDLGIDPPTGVLLYGPPGTGKTLIARAVAATTNATFYHVSGPEITSKYKGESEERLREIFEDARESAPAIIFFDELDAIAAEREAGSDMESRIVAQLLSLLDGLDTRGDVLVVGATNRVDAIDPALRRPGRFDREIEIGVPSEGGRREILEIHTRGVPLADDVDLDRLAARTHGFVGADIRALVTEAAMHALRRARDHGNTSGITLEQLDFDAALATTEPSAMREFIAEVPETTFDDIGGLSAAKDALRESIEWPLLYPDLFEAAGTNPPTGILLYGPPGTGKTLLARAIANESDVNFVHVAGPELLDKYVGESELAVREVFERARQSAPSIVFFDEIDAITTRRHGENEVTDRVVSQLLTELDGLVDNPNVVVLAATNRKHVIDPAVLRPGRLEAHVEVPRPDQEARLAILYVHTRDMPLADSVDLEALAAELDGMTGADIEAVTRNAAMSAIREIVTRAGGDPEHVTGTPMITHQHLRDAIVAMDASE